jgi:predicted dienelactone hydrolase
MSRLSSFTAAVGAAALFLTSTVGCTSSTDSSTGANVDELFQQGPYEVGYREIAITYSDAASMEPRELVLRVWYPAQSDSGAGPAQYSVAGIVDLPSPFALDAPPVTDDDNLPLTVHSHGNGADGLLAYPYGELMASHGWVFVAPNHTGNTVLDPLLDTADPFTLVGLNRPIDISAVIDELESGLVDDELEGKADTSRVFLFGHSFGGYTSFTGAAADVDFDALEADCDGVTSESCDVLADPNVEAAYRAGFGDPRVVAIAPQAPALIAITDSELAALGVPTMLMSGRLDQTTPQEEHAEPSWAGTTTRAICGSKCRSVPTIASLRFATTSSQKCSTSCARMPAKMAVATPSSRRRKRSRCSQPTCSPSAAATCSTKPNGTPS